MSLDFMWGKSLPGRQAAGMLEDQQGSQGARGKEVRKERSGGSCQLGEDFGF